MGCRAGQTELSQTHVVAWLNHYLYRGAGSDDVLYSEATEADVDDGLIQRQEGNASREESELQWH